MRETGDTPWQLVTRHLSGVTSPDEERQLREWTERDPSREVFLRSLSAAWDTGANLPERFDAAAAWKVMHGRIAAATESERSVHAAAPARAPARTAASFTNAWRTLVGMGGSVPTSAASYFRVAAALAFGVAIASGAWWLIARTTSDGAALVPPAATALRETSTARGERATIRLADGTSVTLGVATSLRYPTSFRVAAGASRDVYLDGEAYFEVSHDLEHPFVVHARGTLTRVRGTKFVVDAYAEDSSVAVAVTEGKVLLESESTHPNPASAVGFDGVRAVELVRGSVGRLAPGGRVIVAEGADVASYLAWKEGRLVFHDESLSDVARHLVRWFDIDIQLADSAIASRRLTASMNAGSLDDVLNIMDKVLDVCSDREGRAVVFFEKEGGRCAEATGH